MKFDPTKPFQTRDGRKARLLCTDAKGRIGSEAQPIVALITRPDGTEFAGQYTIDGHFYTDSQLSSSDLVNIPVEHEGWVNVYSGGAFGVIHETKEQADKKSDRHRIACIHIKFKEGEGL